MKTKIEELILEPSAEELNMSCEELYFTEVSNYFKAIMNKHVIMPDGQLKTIL